MIKTVILEKGQKPTPEQLMEVEEASKLPINFDEDCEELSPEMIDYAKRNIKRINGEVPGG